MKVLYYPYSRCFNDDILKKMFLLFEKTFFVDSRPVLLRNLILKSNLDNINTDFYEDIYDIAREGGIIDYFDPSDILKRYDDVICANVKSDIEDINFMEKAILYSADSLSVLSERLPPSYKTWFYAGSGTYGEAVALQKYIHHNGDCKKLNKSEIYDLTWFGGVRRRTPIITMESAQKILRDKYVYIIGGNPILSLPSYELTFLHLSSLRINEALLICLENNLTMLTDEIIFDDLLRIKEKRTFEMLSDINECIDNDKYKYQLNQLKMRIAVEILNCIFERTDFSQRTIKDILHFRMSNKTLFNNFWRKIEQITTTISFDADDKDIFKQIYNLYTKDIQDFRENFSNAYLNIFGRMIVQSAGVVVPVAITSASLGLPLSTMLLTCATAQMGYLTTTGAEKFFEGINIIKGTREHPYAYLIKAKQEKNIKKSGIFKQKNGNPPNKVIYEGYIVLSKTEVNLENLDLYRLDLSFKDNYLALLSFYKKKKRIFYLVDTNSIACCLKEYKEANSLLAVCRKKAFAKPFIAKDLSEALEIIRNQMPDIKFDVDLMSRYNFSIFTVSVK